MNGVIYEAIGKRMILTATYHDSVRVFQPYRYGTSAEGNEIVEAWQLSDSDKAKPQRDWKTFSVGGLAGLRETGKVFSRPHAGYKPTHNTFTTVFIQL